MKTEETNGEGRGRAVDAGASERSKVDPVVEVVIGGWGECGICQAYPPAVTVGWSVWARRKVDASGCLTGESARVLRTYRDRSGALAFCVALAPWLDGAKRWPTSEELARLEDLACPVVRTDATAGALVRGLVLGGTDPMVDRLAMAYAFGRALDAAPGGQCTDDEEDRQRLALSLAGWWMASRDVECVREGLAMLARGERLDGFRWESWLVSVARIAGVRGAEVSK